MRPDISVLLLSWNTRELTLECLDSLPGSIDHGVRCQVIVVDNGSQDGSAEALARREGIELIANRENRGYAAAVNQAYERAVGEYVLLLNSDIRFEPGSLSVLHSFLVGDADVTGVGPLYLNPDGTPQGHHYRFPTFAMTLASASGVLRKLPWFQKRVRSYLMLDDDFSASRRVDQPSASCLLLRRSCLPARKLMDERYPIYFNDVMLARSLARAGRALWMTPDAVVYHELGASTRLLGGAHRRQYFGSVALYLAATEPRYRVALYRGLVFAQGLVLSLLRKPDALPPGELWQALRGDPGPLPQAPAAI
jgi:GT2 family glycosyltransferase